VRLRAWLALACTACSYDWQVGPVPSEDGSGGAGGGGSVTSDASSAASTTGEGGGAPPDCAALLADYEAKLAAAKACSQSEVGVCDQDFSDICGCKVFLAHLEEPQYPEIAAVGDARDVYLASCTPVCGTCGPELVTGACGPEGMTTVCKP
jgi:hypothetical protein